MPHGHASHDCDFPITLYQLLIIVIFLRLLAILQCMYTSPKLK